MLPEVLIISKRRRLPTYSSSNSDRTSRLYLIFRASWILLHLSVS